MANVKTSEGEHYEEKNRTNEPDQSFGGALAPAYVVKITNAQRLGYFWNKIDLYAKRAGKSIYAGTSTIH